MSSHGAYDRLGPNGFVAEPVIYYANLYPHLREVARQHGYALALHGSLVNDLDVIAVPWVEECSDVETLVLAIAQRAGALMDNRNPKMQPHGRTSWTILFAGAGGYIDLSVMPRGAVDAAQPPREACPHQNTGMVGGVSLDVNDPPRNRRVCFTCGVEL